MSEKTDTTDPIHRRDPLAVRIVLVGLTLAFFATVLILPLFLVFWEGFSKGLEAYWAAITDPAALSAIQLTLFTVAWVVPLNTLFGIMASWAIARFQFKGKTLLTSLVDLPFAVSPVIAGLVFVMLFGARSFLGPTLGDLGIKIIFSTPGVVLATLFVTFPFVARELIPLMETLGKDEEEAALTLGAGGWQIFWRITLPNIKWGLLYGIVLCNARAIGEFGAVSVVSGHIRGLTNTIPLHVEILYSEYQFSAAFAVSTLLVFIAVITIAIKTIVGNHQAKPAREQVA